MSKTKDNSMPKDSNKYLVLPHADDKKISYQVHLPEGKQKKLVFVCVPSLGDLKEEYRLLCPLLTQQDHKVITVDHRGLGRSDTGFKSYAADDCGRDLVHLLDTEISNQDEVILIGNSMGGAAILYAADERPQLVTGLILLNAFVRDHPFPFGVSTLLWVLCNKLTGPAFWSSYYQSLYTLKPSTVPDLIDYSKALKQNLHQSGRMFAVKQQLFASKQACTARLPSLAGRENLLRTLVIFGDKDPDFPTPNGPEKEAQWIVNALQGEKSVVKYELIAGAGHYPHVEATEEVFRHMQEYFKL